MAEIRVERKNNQLWVWFLGLILLSLLAWGLSLALDNRERRVEGGTAEVQTTEAPAPSFRSPVA